MMTDGESDRQWGVYCVKDGHEQRHGEYGDVSNAYDHKQKLSDDHNESTTHYHFVEKIND